MACFCVCVIFFFMLVEDTKCDAIAAFRREIQRNPNNKIIFLDETALKLNEAEKTTIVLPGEPTYVIVEDDSSYAARYDMIAACTSTEVFPPMIYTPEDRTQLNVKGITTSMLLYYIEHLLGQSIGATDRYPMILVCDRANVHSPEKMLEAFHLNSAQNITQIKLMPAKAAKRLNPLDNGIFGYWKQQCRKKGKIKKSNIQHVMTSVWNNLNAELLSSCYKHCMLGQHQNVYGDCPLPHSHTHNK
jgi:hypothetical protein